MTEWMPIETAPRGTGEPGVKGYGPMVLLGRPETDKYSQLIAIGFWNGRSWDDGDFIDDMRDFTHWMPLPEAPPA